jgi:hypothetical protein
MKTSDLKVAGGSRLVFAHKFLQSIDIERHIFKVLDKIIPFKTLRKLTYRCLGLKASSNTGDDDSRHFGRRWTDVGMKEIMICLVGEVMRIGTCAHGSLCIYAFIRTASLQKAGEPFPVFRQRNCEFRACVDALESRCFPQRNHCVLPLIGLRDVS